MWLNESLYIIDVASSDRQCACRNRLTAMQVVQHLCNVIWNILYNIKPSRVLIVQVSLWTSILEWMGNASPLPAAQTINFLKFSVIWYVACDPPHIVCTVVYLAGKHQSARKNLMMLKLKVILYSYSKPWGTVGCDIRVHLEVQVYATSFMK